MRQIYVYLTLAAMLLLSACNRGSHPPRVGSLANDFTVKDSDRTVSLNQLRGQVVVLNFWASWCAPCIGELPSMMEMQDRMRNRGVTVLGISIDVDGDAYHRFIQQRNVNFLTVRDPDQKVAGMYGTSVWPESYIIDREGMMRRKVVGPINWNSPDILEFLSKL
ncbi:MAG TPA: TlpA disulfide reductase family protein [Candidatus Sulfotelmatobacter sp.]|nr:TlpA disulfide reductase family protein [Candidatus Sulfotelmatobacter sp.]